MYDTVPSVANRFRELMMAKSREQRLRMGCSMYDTAKKIAISAIRQQYPRISSKETKAEVFLRFYGAEFSDSQKEKILVALRKD